MALFKARYILNPQTLIFEMKDEPKWKKVAERIVFVVGSIGLSILYFQIYTGVLGKDLPKTAHVKRVNAEWTYKIEMMNRQLDNSQQVLDGLEMRSEKIYRSIFGMNELPEDMKNAGIGGVNRYSAFDKLPGSSPLRATAVRLDKMMRRTYVESKSLDEISYHARSVGDMMSCVPAIPPISPRKGTYHIASNFGHRYDPISGQRKMHEGIDFATPIGNPVYAVGDAVVEKVKFGFRGYGNEIVLDHGFGYKTRYAHLKQIHVAEGMNVKRGECIGATGNSGKSTGPHLHYEVMYKGTPINPTSFYDLEMDYEEYDTIVTARKDLSKPVASRPSKIKKRK